MGIKLVVAVTDDDWFEMLRRKLDLPEVNFWSPAPKNFRALQQGEFFLFKLHAPRNVIVGGGIFAYTSTLPCSLDAAHIRPYCDGGKHEPPNGLLLRSDIHRLFDSGYVTVSPNLHFEVSCQIREEFENGRDYYALHGKRIAVPQKPELGPASRALAWHSDHCFRG